MSPAQLQFAARMMEERDRLDRMGMARAISFAVRSVLGDDQVEWKEI